jgi:hypothetical protein
MADGTAGRDYEERRLAELIVHIANRLIGDPRFGRTKLNKVLFFADFEAYRRTGRSITGSVYQHLPQGPCPHQLLPAINSLGNDVVWRTTETPVGRQHQLVALRSARVDIFDGVEIAIVDEVIDHLRGLTNGQVSELSHETIAWRLTQNGDEIPYGSALLSADDPTDEDLAWLKEIAEGGALDSATR